MTAEGNFTGMSYIEALNLCSIENEALEALYILIDRLTDSDELELLKYPHYQKQLIDILIKPDAVLVCNQFMEPYRPFLDRVLIYKDGMRAPLKTGFPNEYRFMRILTGT